MKKEITCKTGLKKNLIDKKVFEREVFLCQKLFRENKGKCNWGKCKDCGVIPSLYKFYKGKLLETPEKVKKIKDKYLR
jgi:hypothetical protein